MKYNQLSPARKRRVRITESDLRNIVKNTLNEFDDWKAQMMYADGEPEGVVKANKMVQRKHNKKQSFPYRRGESYSNMVSVGSDYGLISRNEFSDPFSDDKFNTIRLTRYGQPGTYSKDKENNNWFDPEKDDLEQFFPDYDEVYDNYYGGMRRLKYDPGFKSAEAAQAYSDAAMDLKDYYSGKYKNRLKKKAASLPNTQSGQDFTPKTLKESIRRAIRRYLR